MESFYGGKQGRSYKIVEHFDSVYAMVLAFQNGGSYTDVGYDEYVIIDTIVNKNDRSNPENGLLYRRGYNYSEQFNPKGIPLDISDPITGADTGLDINAMIDDITLVDADDPQKTVVGSAPKYKEYTCHIFDTIDPETGTYRYELEIGDVKENWTNAWTSLVTHPGGGAEYVGQIVGPKGDTPSVEIVDWQTVLNNTRTGGQWSAEKIQGKIQVEPRPGYDPNAIGEQGYDAQGFLDNLQYAYCAIRDDNNNIVGAYIAFDIPYTIFEFQAESISPYDSNYGTYSSATGQWSYSQLISEQSDSLSHPYYKHYDIKVPKGIHGRDVIEIGVSGTASEQNQYWYYKTQDYNASEIGIVSTVDTIGAFRNIRDIELSSNGHFYVNYTGASGTDQTIDMLSIGHISKLAYDKDCILIQYSDIPGTNPTTFLNNDINQNYLYNGTYWINLGKIYNGTHIFGSFSTLSALKTTYPYGFGKDSSGADEASTQERAGWLATVINPLIGEQTLYAYDYYRPLSTGESVADRWYSIQAIGAAAVNQQLDPARAVIVSTAMPDNDVQNVNGLWFVITN